MYTHYIDPIAAFDSFIYSTQCVDSNHPHTAVLQESPVIVSLNFILTSVDDLTFVLTCTSTNRPPGRINKALHKVPARI